MKTVNKIKQMIADGVLTQEQAAEYFSELAESENEKIRRWLIGFFNQYKIDGFPEFSTGMKVDSIIAWLEKQGEQKDFYTKQQLRDMGFAFTLNGDIVTPEKTNEAIKEYLAHQKKKWEKEQKPTTYHKFRAGDIIRNIKQGFTCKIDSVDTKYKVSDGMGTPLSFNVPFDAEDYYELVEQK